MNERPQLTVRELALELPGITLAHPSDNVPDTSFVVRGGTDQTRVQIDGHAVSAGATGRWNSSDASRPLFDSIEVAKGAGISGANAGESAFGTVNLRTREFAPGRQADVVLGTDSFGGNFSTFAISGNVFRGDRLSYVFEHNLYGYNGPQAGHTVNNVVAKPNGTALLDGSGRGSGPDPSGDGAWRGVTTGLSVQYPCLVADSFFASFRQEEVDRLHGATVTLIHPVADTTLNLSFDYRSDQTLVAAGNPNARSDVRGESIFAYLPNIPSTLAQCVDWSATYTLPVTRRLRLFIGDYFTGWKLHYGTIVNYYDVAAGTASQVVMRAVPSYRHDDPHLGFTWRPQNDTEFRLTAGSAATVPYAGLVAGGNAFSGPFSGMGVGVLAERNPNLQPESTVAYDLGFDHRLHDGTVVAVDAFDNTIHDVFATRVTRFDGAVLGIPPGSMYNPLFATTTIPVNAPLERNYGI